MARQKKRADGLFKVSQTVDGKRIYGYGKTQKLARENLQTKVEEFEANKFKVSKDQTLDEYHTNWEQSRFGVVKENTVLKQRFDYKIASEVKLDKNGKTFGSLKLTEIEVSHVRKVQQELKSKYHTNTVNQAMRHVSHILHDAQRERIIDYNPFCSVKELQRTEEKAVNTIHRALSNEETQTFLEHAKNNWFYDLFRFMLCTGCRVGEAVALKDSDIDYSNNWIVISRTVTRSAEGENVMGDSTKTEHGERKIPLTPQVREIIESQKKRNDIMFPVVEMAKQPIFRTVTGCLAHNIIVNRQIRKICKEAKLDHFSSHSFRDTFATRSIESGMNPKTLQVILGHGDIGITMNLYTHVMDATKQSEMQMVKVI